MYWTDGYDEVRTPMIFHKTLWETSGHLENYSEDMYGIVEGFDGGEEGCKHGGVTDYGLKPMNCPAHCVMYKNSTRSYRKWSLVRCYLVFVDSFWIVRFQKWHGFSGISFSGYHLVF